MPTISSRTPEGSPGKCPVCGQEVRLEVSEPFGDAPCPHCGTLLRFVTLANEVRVFDDAALRRRLRKMLVDQFGVAEEKVGDEFEALRHLDMDSLDIIELIMLVEEDFDDDDEE